jgi:ribonuclease P protein component
VNTERFVLILAPQAERTASARLGITASRKIGGAVQRNRAKRLVRAAFRATKELFPAGIDVVVIVRKPLENLRLADVIREWQSAAAALGRRTAGLLARASDGGKTPA